MASLLGSSVVAGDVFQFDVVFDKTITHAGAYSPFYKFFSSTLDIQSTGSGTLTWSRSDPLGDNASNAFTIENWTTDRFIIGSSMSGPSIKGHAPSQYSGTLTNISGTAWNG